ncbi:hypothetical protein GCM10011332_29410 [Terasakiella brassicae]|uniref:Uncharacterized protein n=1 Tax=Terasakiella brassicae TaxID=1634917 RepID=A0A917FGF9_9PROT|nr:hypothetical protein [Terasakiella brassicae]GGF73466.1 hypothetical protein GCM10011332_29410 [Terasakiella brassicae]
MSETLHMKNPNTGEVKILNPGFSWLAFVSTLLLGIPLFIRRQWMFAVLALLVFPVTLIMGAIADLKFGPAFTIAMLCSAGLGTAFGFLAHDNYVKSLLGRGFQKAASETGDAAPGHEASAQSSFLKSKAFKIGGAVTAILVIGGIALSQLGGSGSASFKPDATTGLIEPTQKSMDGYYLPRCQREIANLMLNPETAQFFEAEYRYWDKPKRTSMRGGISLAEFKSLSTDEQEKRQQTELENRGLVFAQNLSNLPLVNVRVRVKGHNRYGQMVTNYGLCKFSERGQPTAELEE